MFGVVIGDVLTSSCQALQREITAMTPKKALTEANLYGRCC